MKLTRAERWILSNQFEILKRIDPDGARSYEHAIDAINSGYEIEYDSLASHVFEEELSEAAANEVLDILSMFRALHAAGPVEGAAPERTTFRGFDGNNETKQLGHAKYLFKTDRFRDLGSAVESNSHSRVLEMCRRQVAAWRQSAHPHKLTHDDVSRIAASATHQPAIAEIDQLSLTVDKRFVGVVVCLSKTERGLQCRRSSISLVPR